jgi:transcriptional regulator with XRE-family HTH domain
MFEELFYKRLTQLRLQKGVSARDMSLSLGQSGGYINKLENKQMLPSMTVFFYICDYFRITPKDFFDDELNTPAVMRKLINDLRKLNDEQIANVAAIVGDMKK